MLDEDLVELGGRSTVKELETAMEGLRSARERPDAAERRWAWPWKGREGRAVGL
jgi:hypothetical protein